MTDLRPDLNRIYIAGPMRGYPEHNFPAFNSAARYLRSVGYEVENPAEKPEEALLPGFQEDIAFRRKIFKVNCEAICSVDIVALLPGWSNSSGARAEKALAEAIRLQVCYIGQNGPTWWMELDDPFANNVVEFKQRSLPTEAQNRKRYPIASGVIDYFHNALVDVAEVSYAGNEQHNPGQPLHWARSKSGDEADALMRHFLERGTRDVDGLRHSAKMAWRALALLQKEIEREEGLPISRGSRAV